MNSTQTSMVQHFDSFICLPFGNTRRTSQIYVFHDDITESSWNTFYFLSVAEHFTFPVYKRCEVFQLLCVVSYVKFLCTVNEWKECSLDCCLWFKGMDSPSFSSGGVFFWSLLVPLGYISTLLSALSCQMDEALSHTNPQHSSENPPTQHQNFV